MTPDLHDKARDRRAKLAFGVALGARVLGARVLGAVWYRRAGWPAGADGR